MFRRILGSLFLVLSLVLVAPAEEPPNSDIVLLDISGVDGTIELTNPRDFAKSPGYDNQLFFSEDSERVYFTRIEDGNADLWVWSPESGEENLTASDWSEYSPTVVPNSQGLLSTVVVEEDDTQRLWTFSPYAGFQLLFPLIQPVGYHAWSGEKVALFVLGEPHELRVGEWGSDEAELVARDIGRCLQKVPGRDAVSYTQVTKGGHRLNLYDFQSGTRTSLRALPNDIQDYAWLNEDEILTWNGFTLVRGRANSQSDWEKIVSPIKLRGVTRLAVSPDGRRLAVVYTPE